MLLKISHDDDLFEFTEREEGKNYARFSFISKEKMIYTLGMHKNCHTPVSENTKQCYCTNRHRHLIMPTSG